RRNPLRHPRQHTENNAEEKILSGVQDKERKFGPGEKAQRGATGSRAEKMKVMGSHNNRGRLMNIVLITAPAQLLYYSL
ncbi:MAG: hypothetical protein KKH28_04490, partial [Elusimicrobia bacterium]|nr:hypothetical protein [Elusimicrobiota bacterium]